MEAINLAVGLASGLALSVGLFAHWVRLHWLNLPLLALLLGVVVGPVGLGLIDLESHGGGPMFLEVAAQLTLAVALVGVGLELRSSLSAQLRPLAVLVIGGLVLMWAVSSVLVGLILGLGLLPALLLGAVLAPTDPILAASVATGRVARDSLPERIRHVLTGESAARHGLSLIFVLLPVLLLAHSPAQAWSEWLTETLLWKSVAAVAVGTALGLAAGRAQRWSASRNFLESGGGPLVALLPALGLTVVAALELARMDGLLGVLAAGIAFAWTVSGPEKSELVEHQERMHQSLLKLVLQVPVFLLLGIALPWSAWGQMGWEAPALVIAVLLLRRIPVILLLRPLVGSIRSREEALFVGWFGPIGVGALYLATVAYRETELEIVWDVTTLLVAASIVANDVTTTPMSHWLGRHERLRST